MNYTRSTRADRSRVHQLHFYFELKRLSSSPIEAMSRLLCKPINLIKKLMKAKQETQAGKRPELVKTYLRSAIIFPEMIGGVVGVHNGKTFKKIGIRPEMVGHYLGEFASTRKRRPHAANQASKSPKSPRK